MTDVLKGLEMCDKHIYKMTRWNNGRGGASKISPSVVEDDIMALVTQKIVNFMPLLPVKFSDIQPRDVWIPRETWKCMGEINRFITYQGDSSIIGITLIDGIIDMKRFGIHDVRHYRRFIERLDMVQPQTFSDFIQICIEYEKEMKR